MPEVQDSEAFYVVPSHLDSGGSIGPVPERTFWVMLGATPFALLIAMGMYVAFGATPMQVQGARFWIPFISLVGLIAYLISLPFAIPWLTVPFEHGLLHSLSYKFRKLKQRSPQHHKWLAALEIEGQYVKLPDGSYRAILLLPTINLDLASVASKQRHRRQIGQLLDGISAHEIQIVVRARPQSFSSPDAWYTKLRLNHNPFSRKLAEWLSSHLRQTESIERRRYLIVPGPDADTLASRCATITNSFVQAGLGAEWIEDPEDLRDVINGWWTWRPHPERFGPELTVETQHGLQSDGEFIRVYAMHKTPTRIQTNWWKALLDADLPVDVSMSIRQQNLQVTKFKMEQKYNQLASSSMSPGRRIALEQINELRLALETKIRPWDVQILFTLRGATQQALQKRCERFEQQCLDLGTKVCDLRWEHYAGMVSASPLCMDMLSGRRMLWESGTLARTSMAAASSLQMNGGVPWGYSESSPILLTTRGMRTGRHFGWFGKTGSGKGFGIRAYLARRHFADRLRIFMWDADDMHHEYAGRFTDFLDGVRLVLNDLDSVRAIELDPRWLVVSFDVSGMPTELHPKAFALVKHKIEEHTLTFAGETAFVVDEATTLAEHPDQSGALALGDAVQRWRKRGIEVHVLTQRVSDWFGTAIGRKIQGNLSVKWYGMQEDSEISEIASKVNLSSEEAERISGAGIGQGLLVAFGTRVWANLYDHASDEEYAAYHTDPPDSVSLLNRGIA